MLRISNNSAFKLGVNLEDNKYIFWNILLIFFEGYYYILVLCQRSKYFNYSTNKIEASVSQYNTIFLCYQFSIIYGKEITHLQKELKITANTSFATSRNITRYVEK